MGIMDALLDPQIDVAARDVALVILPITGTLLGLVYAGLIYWLQGGISQLAHTRSIVGDLMDAQGRCLLDVMVGATAVSLFAAFGAVGIARVAFWLAAVALTIDVLQVCAEQGSVAALLSSKFVPRHYGCIRGWLRRVRNAGPRAWGSATAVLLPVVCYPVAISAHAGSTWIPTEKAIVAFILASTAVSLIQVRSLLMLAVSLRRDVAKQLEAKESLKAMSLDDNRPCWSDKRRDAEALVLSESVRRVGVRMLNELAGPFADGTWTSRDLRDEPLLMGPPIINEHGGCHLNMVIPYLNNPESTREFIYTWARSLMEELASSRSEVPHYTLSFFRKDGEDMHNLAIVRASGDEVRTASKRATSAMEFVRNLPGKYLAPAIADF